MRMRPRCLVTVLVLTMWALAGLITLTCSCCAVMGATCPSLCAAPPSVLSASSSAVLLPMDVLHLQLIPRPATPLGKVPTPPPKSLALFA